MGNYVFVSSDKNNQMNLLFAKRESFITEGIDKINNITGLQFNNGWRTSFLLF